MRPRHELHLLWEDVDGGPELRNCTVNAAVATVLTALAIYAMKSIFHSSSEHVRAYGMFTMREPNPGGPNGSGMTLLPHLRDTLFGERRSKLKSQW